MTDEGDRLAWFREARFGLFVHFGAYSQFGWEPSWPLVGGNKALPDCQDVPVDEYYGRLLGFAPEPGAMRAWASIARRCGMRYAVLTTKHHDGFCLFPWHEEGALSVAQARAGRDLVAEFVEAFRAQGLRVGFYYSLSDWHHPDYPAFTDAMRPYPFIAYPRPEPERWARYQATLRGHLDHLLTAYGPVDVLWFDGGWERTVDEWDSPGLTAFIKERQPDVIVNDRLPGAGDYRTPEQGVPVTPPDGPWETCMTLGRSWGDPPDGGHRKAAPELLRALARVAARGGNLLLNVSPDGTGTIPAWQRERLEAIAAWIERNGPAVLGAGRGLSPWQADGATTRNGSTVHLVCPYRPIGSVDLRGVPVRRVRSARALGTGQALAYQERLDAVQELLNPDPVGDLVIEVPDEAMDPLATVVTVEFDGDL